MFPFARIAFLAGLVGLSGGAFAQDKLAPRYSMTPVDGGLMRLDGATGRMSLCNKAGDTFACKAIEDDRSAFMDEIEALAKENADLKAKVAAGGGNSSFRLPEEKEIDRALGMMDKMMRHFMERDRKQPVPQGGNKL
jgi:hypothetical protein